jgi:hypothetical protein
MAKKIVEKKQIAPYEKTHELSKLRLFITIVNEGQASAIVKIMEHNESSTSCVILGRGTASKDIYEVLGIGEEKKQIILSVVREDKINSIKEELSYRFSLSSVAKGIGFSVVITSLIGVSLYKFLSNTKTI